MGPLTRAFDLAHTPRQCDSTHVPPQGMDMEMIRIQRRCLMTGVAAFARDRVTLTAAASEPGLHARLEHAHMGASS